MKEREIDQARYGSMSGLPGDFQAYDGALAQSTDDFHRRVEITDVAANL